jgi:hypothetical protein
MRWRLRPRRGDEPYQLRSKFVEESNEFFLVNGNFLVVSKQSLNADRVDKSWEIRLWR